MALGTPFAGAVTYSSSGGTSISPSYPTGIAATDVVLLFLGQKPSTANGGTATTPAGWTLREEITGAGGYGTTLGADTGNTNLRIYSWDAPVAGQTGTRPVTLSQNNVSWAFIVGIPTGGGAPEFGSADGSRTTAPTAGTPFTVALTNGASATNFEADDIAIWGMCIPTDITTPAQFSAQSVTATGATFATAVELREPDSITGNDIGGYAAYARVTAGASTTAPSATVTAAGTTTDVRGPVAMLRVREGAAPQSLTPTRFDNTNAFHNPTITQTIPAQDLSPDRYDNTNAFFTADVTQSGGAQSVNPDFYSNTNVFYSATVAAFNTLTPARYDNDNVFYSASVNTTRELTPSRFDNTSVFYSPSVTADGAIVAPDLYINSNTFYATSVDTTYALIPARFDNASTFYSAAVTADSTLAPTLYTNSNTFYSVTASATYDIYAGPYVDDSYVDPLYIGLSLQNVSQFFSATVTPAAITLTPSRYDNTSVFYSASVVQPGVAQALVVELFTNANTFFSPTVTNGSIQPAQPSGSLVRPRRKFRPVVLFDLPEEKVVLPDLSAKTRLAGLSATLVVAEVVATLSNPVEIRLPKPINAKATLPFTQIQTYLRGVTAESSWNDPNDDELLFILDFILT